MYTGRGYEKKQKGCLYDGYKGEPIWQQPSNKSRHYDFTIDSQCRVPIADIDELKKELGLD